MHDGLVQFKGNFFNSTWCILSWLFFVETARVQLPDRKSEIAQRISHWLSYLKITGSNPTHLANHNLLILHNK